MSRNIGATRPPKKARITKKGDKIETVVFGELQKSEIVAPEHRNLAKDILTESVAELLMNERGTKPADIQKKYAEILESEPDPAMVNAKGKILKDLVDLYDQVLLAKKKQSSLLHRANTSVELLEEKKTVSDEELFKAQGL